MRGSFFVFLFMGLAHMPGDGFSQENSGALFTSNLPAVFKLGVKAVNQKSEIRILEIEYSSRRSDIPINEDKMRSNIRSKKGGVYSQGVVDEDIKYLYQTGDFQNVQICVSEMRDEDGERGVRLGVFVDPKVRVAGVDVKRKREDGGLDDLLALKKVDLLNVQLKETVRSPKKVPDSKTSNPHTYKLTQNGDILNPERLYWEARAMEKLYKEKGYYEVRIDVKENYLKDGMATVIFEILEGTNGFIKKVRFLGNHEVSEMDFLKVIHLKPNELQDMGSQSELFDEITLKDDIEQIKNLYLNRGFLDVNVRASLDSRGVSQNESASGSQFNFSPKNKTKDLTLCYRIEEGQRYGVSRISVSGNSFFSESDILKELRNNSRGVEIFDTISLKFIHSDGITRGRAFSVNGLQASMEILQEMYGRMGFREVRVEWKTEPSEKKGELDVHFKIVEGEKFQVDKVIICGNTLSKDEVIRREILLASGDVFDTEKEKKSKENMLKTGLFSMVETYAEETDRPNYQKLIIKVVEKPTQLTFGIGMSYFWNWNSERSLVLGSYFPFIITLNFSQNWGLVFERLVELIMRK
jgi:outer membrane protein insertion porin family